MPNWCSNSVSMTHTDPAMIQRAVAAFNEGRLLEEFVPIPEELKDAVADHQVNEELVAKYGYSNWYDFAVNEWGTKWDVEPFGSEVSEDGLTFECSFDTAWSPPIEAFIKMEKLGFTIDAKYYESGMAFVGEYITDIGESYFDIPNTSGEILEMIPTELDQHFGISEYYAEMEQEEQEENA